MQRRSFLKQSLHGLVVAALGGAAGRDVSAGEARPKLPVAGVTTVYQRNSHADVILGKILEGYDQKGGRGPDLKLASLYLDQPASSDLGRALAEKYRVPILPTIREALTLGGQQLAVRGVLSIGEHGQYPSTSDTHQHMYPRRRFFDEIAATFEACGRVVPVFNDKHLAYNWADARHMVDTAKRLRIPFMAGSSVPVAWRKPALALPMHCQIEEALVVGYGGAESYGFHAVEGLQCMVERRHGGETGIAGIQAVSGNEIWNAEKAGRWSRDLLTAALSVQSDAKAGRPEDTLKNDAPFYLLEYRDGLKATVAIANGLARQFSFAARLKGQEQPVACLIELEEDAPFGHFSFLVRAIEHMVHTGEPAYPVERTLLTTGILDRALHSLADNGRRLETPELNVAYTAADWPFAKTPVGVPPEPAG